MKYDNKTGEFYSNDNHEDFPIGMKFTLDGFRFSVCRVDDIDNIITCVSKTHGFTYINLEKLKELLENGEAERLNG